MNWLCLILIVLLLAVVLWLIFSKKKDKFSFDEIDGHEFEEICARLLEDNGFEEVEVTKGSRDYGVDILAKKDMVTYAIQCKVYAGPVGIKAVQEVCAGREYYERMVGVVMTNQIFTEPAKEAAKKLRIILWDGEYLDKLMDNENN